MATPASATLKSVSEVASLMRLSPASRVITRRGSPSRRPTAAAATASGGATTAPSTSAAANESDGCTSTATSATARAVTSTSPTPSRVMAFQDERKSRYELDRAAEYSSGGRTNSRTTCASISNRGTPGTNEATSPTATITSGAGHPLRRHRAATSTAAATRANTWTWCTGAPARCRVGLLSRPYGPERCPHLGAARVPAVRPRALVPRCQVVPSASRRNVATSASSSASIP